MQAYISTKTDLVQLHVTRAIGVGLVRLDPGCLFKVLNVVLVPEGWATDLDVFVNDLVSNSNSNVLEANSINATQPTPQKATDGPPNQNHGALNI